MREYHRFLRGMVAWAGYKTVVASVHASANGSAGKRSTREEDGAAGVRCDVLVFAGADRVALVIGLSFLVWPPPRRSGSPASGSPDDSTCWCRAGSSLMFMVLLVGGTLMIASGGRHLRRLHFSGGEATAVYLVRAVHAARASGRRAPETARVVTAPVARYSTRASPTASRAGPSRPTCAAPERRLRRVPGADESHRQADAGCGCGYGPFSAAAVRSGGAVVSVDIGERLSRGTVARAGSRGLVAESVTSRCATRASIRHLQRDARAH